jgi:hypothetical protein
MAHARSHPPSLLINPTRSLGTNPAAQGFNLGSVAVLRRVVVGALVAAMNRETRMMVIGLGALLVFGGVLYMVRAVIWRGALSGPGSSRSGPVRGTLEPPRRGVGFLGLGANWPGLLLIAIGAILLLSGIVF